MKAAARSPVYGRTPLRFSKLPGWQNGRGREASAGCRWDLATVHEAIKRLLMIVSPWPTSSEECRRRSIYASLAARRYSDTVAKRSMLFLAVSYETLAAVKMSLEREVELRAKSEDMMAASMIEAAKTWRWVG